MLKVLLTLVLLALCAGGAWYMAHPEAWNQRSTFVGELRNRLAGSASPPLAGAQSGSDADPADQSPAAVNPASSRPLREVQSPSACGMPATTAVTRVAAPTIYRWTDASGVTHFSDQPAAQARVYDPQLPDRLRYFKLSIEYRSSTPVPFIKDELTAQVTGIYEILAGLMGQQRLRQVNLNLVLFPDAVTYQQYAGATTGRSMANTGGFYSTRTNEAVTYVFADRATTLEVARHEATHVISRGILGLMPQWLNEGLSEYFSGLAIQGQYSEVKLDEASLQLARRAVASGYPEALTNFLAMDFDAWNSSRMDTHYALARTLVHFMLDDAAGRQALSVLMQEIADQYCSELDSVEQLGRLYPGGTGALQRNFLAWLHTPGAARSHIY